MLALLEKPKGSNATAPEIDLAALNANAIDALIAEESLHAYTRLAWPLIEPTTRFINNFHIQAICEHLEAVTRGEIRNLLINIPPRCMKSILVSVCWPTWAWITKPETRWMFASYAQGLSWRDSMKCRRIIESPWYQQYWGDRFRLSGDQNQKGRFENDKTGYRIATSVGGSSTGEGADLLVCDDPHDVTGALSDTQREATIVWHDETWSTRLNSPSTGAKVIVMQRMHEKDLSGHVLELGGYEHLMLPMEFEPERRCKTVIFSDPRKEDGELLWPDRIPKSAVEEGKRNIGAYGAAGQFQQRPAPRGGGLFKREWFEIVDALPAGMRMVRYWDMAATEKTQKNDPDWTVGAKVGIHKGLIYIADIRRARVSPGAGDALKRQTAQLDGIEVHVWIEEEGGSSGKVAIAHDVQSVLQGFVVRGDRATGSKEVRAAPLIAQAENGNVRLLRASWNEDFFIEAETFPAGAHDDQVDAVSGAYSKLAVPTIQLTW